MKIKKKYNNNQATFLPITGTYFCLSMIMITLSTILAVIVTNMFFRGVRINRAPAWLRKVSIFWKKIILRCRCLYTNTTNIDNIECISLI